jgi:HEAT repeat protein
MGGYHRWIKFYFLGFFIISGTLLQAQDSPDIFPPLLLKHFRASKWESRCQALWELGTDYWLTEGIEEPILQEAFEKKVLVLLEEALKDPHQDVCYEAIDLLGKFHFNRKRVVQILKPFLKDSRDSLRYRTVLSLMELGENSSEILAQWIPLLEDPNPYIRFWTLVAFEEVRAKISLKVLFPLLQDVSLGVRTQAIEAIVSRYQWGLEGEDGEELLFFLKKSLRDPEKKALRLGGLQILERIGDPGANWAIPQLLLLIEERDMETYEEAKQLLKKLGSPPLSVLPELIALLSDRYLWIRSSVVRYIGQFGESAHSAIPALLLTLEKSSENLQLEIITTIGKMGSSAKKALPALFPFLEHENAELVRSTRQSIQYIGNAEVEQIPEMIVLLEKAPSDARFIPVILDHLGELGEKSLEAVPVLLEIFQRKNVSYSRRVILALSRIGGDPQKILPVFVSVFQENPSKFSYETLGVLKKIQATPLEQLPLLLLGLVHSDNYLKNQVQVQLQPYLKNPSLWIPAFLEFLQMPSPLLQEGAIEVLGQIGKPAQEALPLLIKRLETLDSGSPTVFLKGIKTLGKLEDPQAIPLLLRFLQQEEATIAQESCEALSLFEEELLPYLPVFYEMLKHPRPSVRVQSIWLLGKLQSPESIPYFLEALQESEIEVCHAAKNALIQQPQALLPYFQTFLRLLKAPSKETRYASIQIIRHLGEKGISAIPLLIQNLQDEEEDVAHEAVLTLKVLLPYDPQALALLLSAFPTTQEYQKKSLITLIGDLGASAQEAVSFLLPFLEDPSDEVQSRTASSLGKIGAKEAEIFLIKACVSSFKETRYEALNALRLLEGTSAKRIEIYLKLLEDESYKIRRDAKKALLELSVYPQEAYPLFFQFVQHSDSGIRRDLLEILGMSHDPQFFSVLLRSLQDPEWRVRSGVCEILGKHGASIPGVFSSLMESLKDEHDAVQLEAKLALAKLVVQIPEAKKNLMDSIKDSATSKRLALAWILSKVDPLSEEVFRAFLPLLNDGDLEIQEGIRSVLVGVVSRCDFAFSVLHEALQNPEEPARKDLTFILGTLEEKAILAIPTLLQLLQDPDSVLYPEVELALKRIGKTLREYGEESTASLFPILQHYAKHSTKEIQIKSIWLIGQYGALARPLAMDLAYLLHQEDQNLRKMVLWTLGELCPEETQIVLLLLPLLEDPLKEIRSETLATLGKMGSCAQIALPHLLKKVLDPEEEIRAAVLEILPHFYITSAEVLPVLLQALEDPYYRVRQNAAMALGLFQEKEAISALKKASNDSNYLVRRASLEALRRLQEEK